jgi:hypothetical protein
MRVASPSCGLVVLAAGACGGGGGFPDSRPPDNPPPNGSFLLNWSVVDTKNANVTCGQVGATNVTAAYHNRAFEGGATEVFVCSTGTGTGGGLPPGIYDFTFELDTQNGALATAPVQSGIEIVSGGTTRLTPLTFTVDATGAVALKISSGKSGGNCGATAMNGAGITQMSIALVHASSGTCEPVTFQISAGATRPAGTYTVSCASPVLAPCIESDQTLSVASMPADAYTIHIRGNEAATTCWSNNDSLSVPAQGATLTRTLNLAFAMGTPGC